VLYFRLGWEFCCEGGFYLVVLRHWGGKTGLSWIKNIIALIMHFGFHE